jgi:suppressor of ftsI
VVGGAPVDTAALQARLRLPAEARDSIHPTVEEVAALPVTRQRTLYFTESADGNTFYLGSTPDNGQVYDPDRDDVVVNLGDIEEWTLINLTGERHVFHIHQLDFLVSSINNQDIDETGLRDVIDLPYLQNGVPGQVKVKIPFTNPIMVGRFVYHCHIVGHEDAGMMANLVVLAPGQTAMAPARMRTVQPAPLRDFFAWMGPWAGRKAVPEPSLWEDSICRPGDAPLAGGRNARALGAAPLFGATLIR